ncbi:hypothetical protein [Paenibacillus radicis (ex Xue et al. 2023)]|uniref:Uncharacterized protein n=1 Tax=Paenibacillus radicis (ex Xue et al. 2023) TaxID=2972489 RepID=A0ABT1YMI0_9BACL|nr:hypothetical protein [Paenibacillus radicis (ex Xue et al. 2023)]MCR8633614.1 hypothetical protein [Paenibacillus radicis (ex Xue et al. 2023)]
MFKGRLHTRAVTEGDDQVNAIAPSPTHDPEQHASTASTELKGSPEVIVPLSPKKSKNQSDTGTASSVIALILCIMLLFTQHNGIPVSAIALG